ncbi:MAG: CHAD domain-containing protein [Gammaproteobacteria bacterium]|nr:CHAD domain-containing protein [Gammaproteobacteria bacterium]
MLSPSAQVISAYARRLLCATDAAVARLADKNDAEALHDSRVSLRRLRGWLRAFDDRLKLKRRQRRELRRLARATNQARDAEVCIHWLIKLRGELDSRAQAGVQRFTAYLSSSRDQNYRHIRKQLPHDWNRLSHKLQHMAIALGDSKHEKTIFQQAYSASLHIYAQNFITTREQACGHPDAIRIHRLRIAGKKLRYLLEYSLPWQSSVRPLVRELRVLHETAGAIQDLQHFRSLSEQAFLYQAGARYRRLLALYADPGADQRTLRHPDLTPGLLPLLWINRAACIRQAQYLERFRRNYLGRKRPACLLHLRQFLAVTSHQAKHR